MAALTESRIQRFLDHAQLALHFHEHGKQASDPSYREVLEFVEEMVDLMCEVRRERQALEQIAGLSEACRQADAEEVRALAAGMCAIARRALGAQVDSPDPAPVVVPPVVQAIVR